MSDDFTNTSEGGAYSSDKSNTSDNTGTSGITQSLAGTLYHYKFWLKFCSVIFILYGIIACLSIIGILYAWLPIWLGLLLHSSTISLDKAFTTGNTNELKTAVTKLMKYFKICAILLIVQLVFTVFNFIFQGLIGSSMMPF